ncbi:MAG: DUF427 domain-containing protein [Pseudomonadota bacterium]
MAEHIKIRPATGTWVVRAGGAVLGESTNALELSEGDLPPVIYFPRDDIAMEFLDASERTSNCPHKGDASYFSIVTKSTVLKDVAWSYEAPKDGVADIAGFLAFYPDQVAVEKL